jgi:hypothetical protein
MSSATKVVPPQMVNSPYWYCSNIPVGSRFSTLPTLSVHFSWLPLWAPPLWWGLAMLERTFQVMVHLLCAQSSAPVAVWVSPPGREHHLSYGWTIPDFLSRKLVKSMFHWPNRENYIRIIKKHLIIYMYKYIYIYTHIYLSIYMIMCIHIYIYWWHWTCSSPDGSGLRWSPTCRDCRFRLSICDSVGDWNPVGWNINKQNWLVVT